MSRSCRPTFSNASRHVCRSSRECSLVTIVRTRALSRATVGKTTDVAKMPSSNNPAASACALDASPRITGGVVRPGCLARDDGRDRRLADARVEPQLGQPGLEKARVVPQPLESLGLV